MADSNFRGPVNAMGSLEDSNPASSATTAVVPIQPLDGPSSFYQWAGLPDVRAAPFPKDGFRPGQNSILLGNFDFYAVDAIPQAAGSTLLAAAQVVTALTPMALATVGVTNFSAGAQSIAVGVPILPQGTTVATTGIMLDFGFTTGTTIANSTAVQVNDTTVFTQGQWIIIGNAGNSSATQSLITQVQTTLNATTIGVLPAPATALGVPIGGANLFGSGFLPLATPFGPSASVPSAHQGRTVAGFSKATNPRETLARNLSVQASTATAGTATILFTGIDVWNQLMSELLTATGTTPAYGKKAWKAVFAAVPQTIGTTISASYSIGLGDTFGFPARIDEYSYVNAYAGNTAVNNNVGITTAVLTNPATNTTGDVRGTIQLSGLGAGVPISNPATTNNVVRLMVVQNLTPYQLINATPNNTVPMFGVANSTN